jgi:peptidoglycan/xylan/chitin deacetylase (PgdA/CDA1 family)
MTGCTRKRTDYRVHLPGSLTRLFPKAVWTIPNNENSLFLTFDDGPVPVVTPAVLEILRERNVKATFFCVGENVQKYPELFGQIIAEGHVVGNHTHKHLQGLKCRSKDYFSDIEQANSLIGSSLFRPPHGLISLKQYHQIVRSYHLVMWDVISCDYDSKLTPEHCFCNVVDFVRSGSIITFHDSEKAAANVLKALPRTIDYLLGVGYSFGRIELPAIRPINGTKLIHANKDYNQSKRSA